MKLKQKIQKKLIKENIYETLILDIVLEAEK